MNLITFHTEKAKVMSGTLTRVSSSSINTTKWLREKESEGIKREKTQILGKIDKKINKK